MIKYRMHIIKPKGMTSNEAVNRIGWNDRRILKKYMLANNQKTAEIKTERGMIRISLEPVREGKTK